MNINLLPADSLLEIFSYLSFSDLGRIAQVCTSWRHLSAQNCLWQQLAPTFFQKRVIQASFGDTEVTKERFLASLPPLHQKNIQTKCLTKIENPLFSSPKNQWLESFDATEKGLICLTELKEVYFQSWETAYFKTLPVGEDNPWQILLGERDQYYLLSDRGATICNLEDSSVHHLPKAVALNTYDNTLYFATNEKVLRHDENGDVALIHLKRPMRSFQIQNHSLFTNYRAISSWSQVSLTSSTQMKNFSFCRWDLETKQITHFFDENYLHCFDLAENVVAASSVYGIHLWDMRTHGKINYLERKKSGIYPKQIEIHKGCIYELLMDGSLAIWHPTYHKPMHQIIDCQLGQFKHVKDTLVAMVFSDVFAFAPQEKPVTKKAGWFHYLFGRAA